MAFKGFGAAQIVTNKGKPKTKELEEKVIKGIADLGAFRLVAKGMLAVEKSIEMRIKMVMAEHFLAGGCKKGKKPDNFTGTDGEHSALCGLRKRNPGVNGLSQEDVEALNDLGLDHVVQTTETYYFDPEYLADPVIRTAIEKALKSVKGLPEGAIKCEIKHTLTDEAIDEAFKLPPVKAKLALSLVTDLAITPRFKLEDGDLQPARDRVEAQMKLPQNQDAIADAVAGGSRKKAA